MIEQKVDNVMLRGIQEDDLHFIFSSWLKSYRSSNFAKNITNTIYFDQQHKLIEHLLSSSQVVIACRKEDPKEIFGYIVASKIGNVFAVHYVYVKHLFRHLGIGKLLLNSLNPQDAQAMCYTHDTPTATRLAAKFGLVYHPFLIFGIVNQSESEAASNESSENE